MLAIDSTMIKQLMISYWLKSTSIESATLIDSIGAKSNWQTLW